MERRALAQLGGSRVQPLSRRMTLAMLASRTHGVGAFRPFAAHSPVRALRIQLRASTTTPLPRSDSAADAVAASARAKHYSIAAELAARPSAPVLASSDTADSVFAHSSSSHAHPARASTSVANVHTATPSVADPRTALEHALAQHDAPSTLRLLTAHWYPHLLAASPLAAPDASLAPLPLALLPSIVDLLAADLVPDGALFDADACALLIRTAHALLAELAARTPYRTTR
jgi:hypothetical protein